MMNNKGYINLHGPQRQFLIEKPKTAITNWGRATGKTFLLGLWISQLIKDFPTCTFLIVGASYKSLKDVTLPTVISALKNVGFYDGYNYLFGRKPKNSLGWLDTREAPLDYSNVFVFPNGTMFQLVSLDKNASSFRGRNVDGILVDEALLLDKTRFDDEVSPTNRGNLKFSNIPYHHGVWYFTSMPVNSEAYWITEASEYYNKNEYNYRSLMDQIADEQLNLIRIIKKHKSKNDVISKQRQINSLKNNIKHYAQNGLYYSESNCFDNILNIGVKYIINEYDRIEDLTKFEREILNKYIRQIGNTFYPLLNRSSHCYYPSCNSDEFNINVNYSCLDDSDYFAELPIHLGMDFGSKINTLCVAQYQRSENVIRFINDFHVFSPYILDDALAKFCSYYKDAVNRTVYFHYDKSGNVHQANSKLTYAESARNFLKKHKFNAILSSKGQNNPEHNKKFFLWSKILDNKNSRYPNAFFNRITCKDLITSMELAPSKKSGIFQLIQKDKSSENKVQDQSKATHKSDSADFVVWDLFENLISNINSTKYSSSHIVR